MKFVLILLTTVLSVSMAEAASPKPFRGAGIPSKQVTGCYVIKIRIPFISSMDYHVSVPGDGTLKFLASTKNQGAMPIACTGTVAYTTLKANAAIDCSRMIQESIARGKEYVWEKNFAMNLDFTEAKRVGKDIDRVKSTLIQGSNGDKHSMSVKMQSETCL